MECNVFYMYTHIYVFNIYTHIYTHIYIKIYLNSLVIWEMQIKIIRCHFTPTRWQNLKKKKKKRKEKKGLVGAIPRVRETVQ